MLVKNSGQAWLVHQRETGGSLTRTQPGAPEPPPSSCPEAMSKVLVQDNMGWDKDRPGTQAHAPLFPATPRAPAVQSKSNPSLSFDFIQFPKKFKTAQNQGSRCGLEILTAPPLKILTAPPLPSCREGALLRKRTLFLTQAPNGEGGARTMPPGPAPEHMSSQGSLYLKV